MAKHSDNTKSEQTDIGLPSTSIPSGPVECLGMTFPSDDERRKYFLEKLAVKLNDPEFRKIEGFPIGEDEDILALSDPPYYTACPNPWLADFVRHYGHPYNPKVKYHREPFAADVSEGKTHPIYTAHSYHTKVPHRAIMRYILHYTEPGDLIFDGFAGTGMTGVAAQLCGDKTEVQALDYRITDEDKLLNGEGKVFSRIGVRRTILNELSPAATFISSNYNGSINVHEFDREANRILRELEEEYGWMYKTIHTDGKSEGHINFTVWSDVFVCPECAGEVIFRQAAVDPNTGNVKETFPCPHCNMSLTKRSMEHAWVTKYDPVIRETIRQIKQIPVLINYNVSGTTCEKKPTNLDLALLEDIEKKGISYWFPKDRMMEGHETRRNDPLGYTHVHHFYTKRNLWTLSVALGKTEKIESKTTRSMCRFLFQQWAIGFSKLNRYSPHHYSQNNRNLSGTLYIGSQIAEVSPTYAFKNKLKRLVSTFVKQKNAIAAIATQSSESMPLPDASIDYIFLDPPFGSNLNYAELNFLWESWLRVWTNTKSEAIENSAQGKGIDGTCQ